MRLEAVTPGRICLFGEHQDYLGLPVIAAAVNLEMRISLTVEHDCLNRYRLILHNMDHEEIINTAMPIVYRHKKDFLRAVVKVLDEEGVALPKALTAEIDSTIPIEAGTSSSSALSVAWTGALLAAARDPGANDPGRSVTLAHRAEVIEFDGSGGMMDQATIGHGGLVYFRAGGDPELVRLPARPKGFVLGDSREPKDTQAVLSRVRGTAERALSKMEETFPGFSLEETPLEEAEGRVDAAGLDERERAVLLGNLEDRDILRRAFDLLSREEVEPAVLGGLLARHHEILRDNLGISTPKVERMLDAAMEAGALGGKINGSGGGGCLFAYAPSRTAEVAAAFEEAGGRGYPVEIAGGLRIRVEEG